MSKQRMDWNYTDTEGNPIPPNHRIMPDHYLVEIRVVVRSTQPIVTERVKDLIQTKFEVTEIDRVSGTCVAKDIQTVVNWGSPAIEAAAKEVIGKLPKGT